MESEEGDPILNYFQSNAILNLAMVSSFIGAIVFGFLAFLLASTSAFLHLCILSVLMLGLFFSLVL
jgi:hypothetical protein